MNHEKILGITRLIRIQCGRPQHSAARSARPHMDLGRVALGAVIIIVRGGFFKELLMPEVMIEWSWTSFLILPQNVRKVLGAEMPLI